MTSQITHYLGIIADAIRKIEDLVAPPPQESTVQIPVQAGPTPVPGVRVTQVPADPPSMLPTQDSFQAALSHWKSGMMNYSTVLWVKCGMVNWVDSVDPSAGEEAIGCSMAFISYLLHQGITLSSIEGVSPPGTTPAHAYEALNQGLASQAWPVFSGVIRALGGRLGSSDPFGMIQAANRPRPIQHV